MVSGNYLSHMRFGSYTDVNHNNNPNSNPAYVFALGSVTPQADMPKSGKATYSGLALASPIGGVYEEGTSTFNVDFGTKKLNGSVSVGRWNPVSLTATNSLVHPPRGSNHRSLLWPESGRTGRRVQ